MKRITKPKTPLEHKRVLRSIRCHPSTWAALDQLASMTDSNVGRVVDAAFKGKL